MNNKRRRTSSVASRSTEDDPDDMAPEPAKRRKKLDPSDLCHQLYDALRSHKKEDGSLLCDSFIRVPKRRQEPGYYEVVTNPMDFLKVQQKLKTDEYKDMDEFANDIQLMVNNAKAFYSRNTTEYKDALQLWDFCISTKNRILEDYEDEPVRGRKSRKSTVIKHEDTEDTSESSTNPDEDVQAYEDLFNAVMLAADPADSNRPLHVPFLLKPSKKLYPEYYEVIDQPIDLKTIATKIQEGSYNNLAEMERDLMLMCRNACNFNEPGSWIYKDAKLLKKIITIAAKKQTGEITGPVLKSMTTTRSKRNNRSTQSLIAQSAALRDEDEESDEEEEDPLDTEESDNPQWQLFQTIRTAPNSQGLRMSEFFWTLPSQKLYPDYYKTIKNPISLLQIRKRIKGGEYDSINEVAADMNIVFENAKKYNAHTTRLYKFAVKLQKVMQDKVQELSELDQESEEDEEEEENEAVHPNLVKRASNVLTRGKYKDNIPLKRRLHKLVKCVVEYVTEDGRQPILLFNEKPSKKLYPSYYQVIAEPIDMMTIEANIKSEKYHNDTELVDDLKLMFKNCRQYNEVGSSIWADAKTLEKVLTNRVKELGPLPDSKKSSSRPIGEKNAISPIINRRPRKVIPLYIQKMRTMYDTIKDYHDTKGRQLSLIFMKLPNSKEYPDYYEVIKQPIHMEKIASILKNNGYDSLDELVSDLLLMFDNACKYNEPDSQIYKDALTLQRLVLQTKLQLSEDEENVPDVTAAVQEILASIFTAVYNHQDEEGRCFSDSMAELPEHDVVDGKKVRGLSLDLIKRRLDKGVYKRLDRFQEDIFSCLERARKLSRSDSQVFEDSIELQSFFIRNRDEVTKSGDLLHSPALNYSLVDLANQVADLKRIKIQEELSLSNEDESCDGNDKDEEASASNNSDNGVSMSYNQETYRAGDFAYIEPTERGMETSVVLIERLWTNSEGQQMLYGNIFYRPNETFHLPTRKFLDKELFKSDSHVAVPLSKVAGKCCVLSVKDFFRMVPEGFSEKDVYVCESRYSTRARSFKKIKIWNFDADHLKLTAREEPIEPKRVFSVYKERLEKHKEEIAELEEGEKLVEKDIPNIIIFNADDAENSYFEQFNTCVGPVKLGDFVYVATDGGKQQVAQVDSIWSTKDDKCYFRGPFMLGSTDITHAPMKLFYKQEMFLSTVEATHPIVAIVGKCAVLDYGEYTCSRPTEIPEDDVFICESLFDENKNVIKKLGAEGIKKFTHSNQVIEDEIYFFRKPINPVKVLTDSAMAQNSSKMGSSSGQYDMEGSPYSRLDAELLGMGVMGVGDDSMDAPPSVCSTDTSVLPTLSNSHTPVSSRKKTAGRKLVTGYILYAGKMRTQVTQANPDSTFGEISRIVGNEWRKLPQMEKSMWEERANKINEEGKVGTIADTVYECCWENCDYQFEDMADCIEHSVAEQTGHVQTFFSGSRSDMDYHCQWRNCQRMKKSVPPFPSVQRLARHVKEVHILKSTGRMVPPMDRSKNFVPSKAAAAIAPMETETTVAATQTNNLPAVKQQEPLFIAVPPRPSRVLHSDAYLKYIEGLTSENRYISNWEKQISAAPENTQVSEATTLPAEWLGNGVGNHGNLVKALWNLRNMMMRDVLAINKTL